MPHLGDEHTCSQTIFLLTRPPRFCSITLIICSKRIRKKSVFGYWFNFGATGNQLICNKIQYTLVYMTILRQIICRILGTYLNHGQKWKTYPQIPFMVCTFLLLVCPGIRTCLQSLGSLSFGHLGMIPPILTIPDWDSLTRWSNSLRPISSTRPRQRKRFGIPPMLMAGRLLWGRYDLVQYLVWKNENTYLYTSIFDS